MSKKEEGFDWRHFIFVLCVIATLVALVFIVKSITTPELEAQEFCKSQFNGTMNGYPSKHVCLVQQGDFVYGVKLIKYNDEWRVYVE